VTIPIFVQDEPGVWSVRKPLPFRFGGERHEVPIGFRFDTGTRFATRHLPLARLDLRDFAAADHLVIEYGYQHGLARGIKQSAALLNETLAASGVPVLARARMWVVLSWQAVFYELRATDVRLARRLHRLASGHLVLTVAVSAMLVGLAVFPFMIGMLLPGVPFLDTAAGAGVAVLAEAIAATIWRRVVRRRSSSPFAWL
jgi:hypothetical protein